MNISLIGMRGAGKSNVARRLSVVTKRPVLSTDLLIEYDQDGKSITEILASFDGDWRRFRDLEHRVVARVMKLDDVIVDCGGGVIVDLDSDGVEVFSERKVSLLQEGGPVVWLRGDIDALVDRIRLKELRAVQGRNQANRPPLTSGKSASDAQSLARIMRNRLPFYEHAATVTVDIDGKERFEIADEILAVFSADLGVTLPTLP